LYKKVRIRLCLWERETGWARICTFVCSWRWTASTIDCLHFTAAVATEAMWFFLCWHWHYDYGLYICVCCNVCVCVKVE